MNEKYQVRCIFEIYETEYIDTPLLESFVDVPVTSKEQSVFANTQEQQDLIQKHSLFSSTQKQKCTVTVNYRLVNKTNQKEVPVTSNDFGNVWLEGEVSSEDCGLEFTLESGMSARVKCRPTPGGHIVYMSSSMVCSVASRTNPILARAWRPSSKACVRSMAQRFLSRCNWPVATLQCQAYHVSQKRSGKIGEDAHEHGPDRPGRLGAFGLWQDGVGDAGRMAGSRPAADVRLGH